MNILQLHHTFPYIYIKPFSRNQYFCIKNFFIKSFVIIDSNRRRFVWTWSKWRKFKQSSLATSAPLLSRNRAPQRNGAKRLRQAIFRKVLEQCGSGGASVAPEIGRERWSRCSWANKVSVVDVGVCAHRRRIRRAQAGSSICLSA